MQKKEKRVEEELKTTLILFVSMLTPQCVLVIELNICSIIDYFLILKLELFK